MYKVNRIPSSDDSKAFFDWMVNKQNLSVATSRSYSSGINNCEQLAIQLGLSSTSLYGVDFEDAKKTAILLKGTSLYKEMNAQQHNRLNASLSQLLKYLADNQGEESNSQNNQIVSFIDPTLCELILEKQFPKGIRIESFIGLKKFIKTYNEIYESSFESTDTKTQKLFAKELTAIGIHHEDRVFAPGSIMDAKIKTLVIDYIHDKFEQGDKVVFYTRILNEFEEILSSQQVYDTAILKAFLERELGGSYIFENEYISLEKQEGLEPKNRIANFLLEYGEPMHVSELSARFPEYSEKAIQNIISKNKEFIFNTAKEYFNAGIVEFTEEEIAGISALIYHEIEHRGFLSGEELVRFVFSKFSSIPERYPTISKLGLRNVIAYYLKDKFSFNHGIICSLEQDLSMSDVYASFAKTHESFSLDDLNALKSDLGCPIYFDSVYSNAVRVSQNLFVSKNSISFNIERTDWIIGKFCIGSYIPISSVSNFSLFPSIEYPWNSFLLESYVYNYSKDFKLLHNGFAADNCVGAIVKANSDIDSFPSLLVEVLKDSSIDLTTENALSYLNDCGYLARKRNSSSIESIVTKAKRGRN